jgi:hypothetical protein
MLLKVEGESGVNPEQLKELIGLNFKRRIGIMIEVEVVPMGTFAQ